MTTEECIKSLSVLLECVDDKLQGEWDKMTKLVNLKPSSFEFVLLETIERLERHGRWIQSDALDYKDPNGVTHIHGMCSCCRLIYDFRDMTSRFNFCPNCGARMDGGSDNG